MEGRYEDTMKFVIGIDLGGTYIKGGLVDHRGKILYFNQVPTESAMGFKKVMDNMLKISLDILDRHPSHEIIGVGIGIPGWVKQELGLVMWAPNLKWFAQPFTRIYQEKISLPVFLENDANAAALGEYWLGRGSGSKIMLMITLGTGVGSGLIIDGRIFRGSSGMGVELGHMTLNPDGPLCGCGGKGCLESYASAGGMLRIAHKYLQEQPETEISSKDLDMENLLLSMENKRSFAFKTLEEVSGYLSTALVNTILAYDPDRIVLGGGIAEGGEYLIETVKEKIHLSLRRFPDREIVIDRAILGNKAGILGAAYQVWRGGVYHDVE